MANKLWLVWKTQDSRRRYVIGTLEKNEVEYLFKYTNPELNEAISAGFEYFPGFDDLKKTYRNDKLFSNIESRLPNSTRPDYLNIMNLYELEKDSSSMKILEATKGRLLTDNYEFVPSFENTRVEFEIAGTKYYDAKKVKEKIKLNDDLFLILESTNIHDENAIKVMCKIENKDKQLGYVPRYYSKQLTEMLKKNVKYSAKIKSLNFDSPLDDEDITAKVKLIFDVN